MRRVPACLLAMLLVGCGADPEEAPDAAFMKSPAPVLPETFHGEALSHWQAALASDDAITRAEAAWAVGELAAGDADALGALAPLLRDPSADVRFAALAALQRAGAVPPALVPGVLAAGAADAAGLQAMAQALLPLLGTEAVVRVLGTAPPASPAFRRAASLASSRGAPAVPALHALLLRGATPEREQAVCETLGAIGPAAAPSVGALIERLGAKAPLGPAAATALGRIGRPAKAPLEAFLASDAAQADAQARLLARLALSRIE